MRFGILGSGSWATALAKILCEQNAKLNWYLRNENTIVHLREKGSNPSYLQSVTFDTGQLKLSSNIREVIDESDLLILAIPSPFLHQSLFESKTFSRQRLCFQQSKELFLKVKMWWVSIFIKFLVYLQIKLGSSWVLVMPKKLHSKNCLILTLACQNQDTAKFIAQQMSCNYIRTKVTDDTIGAEYAGTLKKHLCNRCGHRTWIGLWRQLSKCIDEQFDTRAQALSQTNS